MTPHPAIPDGSCDCHVHIYDPAQGVAADGSGDGSGRVMPEATLDAYCEVQARLGLQRAVIVQPNAYGTDNMTTLAAVAALGANARGAAIVTPATSNVAANVVTPSEAPAGAPLIPNSPPKPIRFWFEVGDQDLSYPNPVTADEGMARVLAAKGYHYQFVFARNAKHVDRPTVAQTLPSALEWLWKGYPAQ